MFHMSCYHEVPIVCCFATSTISLVGGRNLCETSSNKLELEAQTELVLVLVIHS